MKPGDILAPRIGYSGSRTTGVRLYLNREVDRWDSYMNSNDIVTYLSSSRAPRDAQWIHRVLHHTGIRYIYDFDIEVLG